ncbi:ankyrin repeat-containing domain protein [Mycena olivaceomarginata]|nr:ankyrin repeat-containing domain protein [Mycena olivaceomarginata]
MQKGADPSLWTADSRFGNALQLVAFYGKIEMLQFLRTKGIQDTPGGHFQTALQSAAAGGHVPMVQFLQKARFEDKPGKHFQTALQCAAAGGHVSMVEFLLEINTYVIGLNEVGGDYGTALCAACANGKVEVVDALLRAGAVRNVDGINFGAPLHVAVLMENGEMVELLTGDNPEVADCEWEGVGKAVDVAGFIQNRPLFDLLRQKGLRGCRRVPPARPTLTGPSLALRQISSHKLLSVDIYRGTELKNRRGSGHLSKGCHSGIRQ